MWRVKAYVRESERETERETERATETKRAEAKYTVAKTEAGIKIDEI